MSEIDQRQQLRQERARKLREENAAALEELERQRRTREYLDALTPDEERADALLPERREWKLPAQERPPRERGRDTPVVNWSSVIDQRIAAEHAFMMEVIGQAIGELREQIEESVRKEFEEQLRQARVDACEAKIRLAELRISFTELREHLSGGHGTTIDLPALPLRGSRAN